MVALAMVWVCIVGCIAIGWIAMVHPMYRVKPFLRTTLRLGGGVLGLAGLFGLASMLVILTNPQFRGAEARPDVIERMRDGYVALGSVVLAAVLLLNLARSSRCENSSRPRVFRVHLAYAGIASVVGAGVTLGLSPLLGRWPDLDDLLVASTLVGAGTAALAYFISPRRAPTRRCPRCAYDLPTGSRCPECGFEADEERAFHRLPRPSVALLIAALLCTSVLVLRGVQRHRAGGWAATIPTPVLALTYPWMNRDVIDGVPSSRTEDWSLAGRVNRGDCSLVDRLLVSHWIESESRGRMHPGRAGFDWRWRAMTSRARYRCLIDWIEQRPSRSALLVPLFVDVGVESSRSSWADVRPLAPMLERWLLETHLSDVGEVDRGFFGQAMLTPNRTPTLYEVAWFWPGSDEVFRNAIRRALLAYVEEDFDGVIDPGLQAQVDRVAKAFRPLLWNDEDVARIVGPLLLGEDDRLAAMASKLLDGRLPFATAQDIGDAIASNDPVLIEIVASRARSRDRQAMYRHLASSDDPLFRRAAARLYAIDPLLPPDPLEPFADLDERSRWHVERRRPQGGFGIPGFLKRGWGSKDD